MIKKIFFILIISCFIFPPSFSRAQDNPVPPQPQPGARPNDCEEQCATFSDDGTEVHLFYKSGRTTPSGESDEIYDYVAISERIRKWADKDTYIFRARNRAFYILLNKQFSVVKNRAHYKSGGNVDWDATPINDQNYKIIGEFNAPTGIRGNARYSWRIVISGKVAFKLNESATPAPASGAFMQIRLDEEKGPYIGEIETDAQGNFEYSNVDTYVNNDKVNNLYIYTKYENNGVKFESDPEKNPETMLTYLDKSWHTHANDDKAKVRGGVDITLTKTVTEFWDPTQGVGQSLLREVTGGKNFWEIDVIKNVVCWLKKFFVSTFYWLSSIAAYFLRENY